MVKNNNHVSVRTIAKSRGQAYSSARVGTLTLQHGCTKLIKSKLQWCFVRSLPEIGRTQSGTIPVRAEQDQVSSKHGK